MTTLVIVIATYSAIVAIAVALTHLIMPLLEKERKPIVSHYKPWAIIDNEFVEFEEVK